jgi:hypothetical protein
MSKLATIIFAILVILHGLIHLMGTIVYMQWGEIESLPYKTTLLNGRWDLGETGIKAFGLLWLIPLVGFVLAGIALLTGWGWWQPLLTGVSLFSLLVTALDWHVAYAGTAVNVIILVVLWIIS